MENLNNEPKNEQEIINHEAGGSGEISVAQPVKGKSNLEKYFLPVSILAAGILISGAILYTNSSAAPAGDVQNNPVAGVKADVSADDDAFLGNKNAPVVMIEFSDFQCPFCRTFWRDTLPKIKKEYIDTGKVKFVYRDFPLSFHPAAQPAAEATECAEEQGKFWELHDKIFQEQEKLGQGTVQFTKDDIIKWAGQISLDSNKFKTCLNSGKYKAEVQKDLSDGQNSGVTGTPGFFVNGKLISGAVPFEIFKQAIDEALKKK